MEFTYEDYLEYNVYEAFRWKTKKDNVYIRLDEQSSSLLENYDWVYQNIEYLFVQCIIDYQNYSTMEGYYVFFKALINKYSMEDDYNKYLCGKLDKNQFKRKWKDFAIRIVEFFQYSFDERVTQLVEKEDVINYFFRYPLLYNHEVIEKFRPRAFNVFLTYESFNSYYIENSKDLYYYIRNNYIDVVVPNYILLNNKVIKDFSHTSDFKEFYEILSYLQKHIIITPYIDEHKKYCDNLINSLNNDMQQDIVIRLFISRYYETTLEDLVSIIKPLYAFATENNRYLQGYEIYDFLMKYKYMTVDEIKKLYHKVKNINLMEILYDDIKQQKVTLVSEINDNIINFNNLIPNINENSIIYYDITGIDKILIVHNTGIDVEKKDKLLNLIERIKSGNKKYICLSLQDADHQLFYYKNQKQKTIKLIYGKLNFNHVGIINHEDAYSTDVVPTVLNNFDLGNRLYTLKNLMDLTHGYNEICYSINGIPFLPIGILCEDEITDNEIWFANTLGIKTFFRER